MPHLFDVMKRMNFVAFVPTGRWGHWLSVGRSCVEHVVGVQEIS